MPMCARPVHDPRSETGSQTAHTENKGITMSQPRHLHRNGASICFATHEARPEALPDALTRYLRPERRTRRTLEIERQGAALAAQAFTVDADVVAFIKAVCWWGGFSGIGGRVIKRNEATVIRSRLIAAKAAVEQEIPDLQTAIRAVRAINSLGLSFASKHLRMLWPQHCPVLDSQIHKQLGYALNSTGYCAFAGDCRAVADFLIEQAIPNPARDGQPVWYVADVEAAVFVLVGN